ncbi:MAG: FAD-binding oxidoreductase [Pseudomonadota bacterium]
MTAHANALQDIREVVGAAGVVDDPVAQSAYLIDERRLYEGQAGLIVRPGSVDEVARVLAICHDARLGVVPQGGNTGYCGGATPTSATQVVVSLSRLNRVREIDAVGHTMTVDAGVVLANAQAAAEQAGLLFPLSMGSEGSCQIGGNLSTNAGGLAVLRYGTARELVLGLEVVLPDGQVINGLTGLRKDNTGIDLKAMFMGAEGTLGIITGAVVKLFPAARSTETAWLAVDSTQAACELLGLARQISGDSVSSFEYVSRASLDLVVAHVDGAKSPLANDAQHFVLMELTSAASDDSLRVRTEALMEAGFEQGLIIDGVLAESGPQRSALWRLRESIPEAEKLYGGAVKHDISVRISRIPEYMQTATTAFDDLGAPYHSVYGHIGDGNLHYNLLPPADTSERTVWQRTWAKRLSAKVHRLAAELDGSFSAEHGIGQLKREDLAEFKDPVALAAMRAIKKALDPHGIMNPGKVL